MTAILDSFRLAFGTFFGNPLRSLLTLLGIVIGVATVIAMMALIEGLRMKVTEDLSQLGADSFQIQKMPQGFGRVDWAKLSKRPNFTLADREAIVDSCPSVLIAAGEDSEGGQKLSTAEKETRPNISVWAGTSEYFQTNSVEIAQGRPFTKAEEVSGRHVIVLGADVVDTLFPGLDPLGQTLRMKGRPFQVIGVTKRRGSFLGGGSQDNGVMIPLSVFYDLFGKNRSVMISVQAKEASLAKRAEDEVVSLMRRRRNLKPMDEDNFFVFSNESSVRMFNQISGAISAAGFGVCLLSLIVGGIGILNIMLVSVTERTREIGVRKALGARRIRILGQFAIEAIVLSLVGGLIGIALGYAIAAFAHWLLGFPTHVPLWAVIVSVLMSSGVGFLFGIYPAHRASLLDPVEAMRNE